MAQAPTEAREVREPREGGAPPPAAQKFLNIWAEMVASGALKFQNSVTHLTQNHC